MINLIKGKKEKRITHDELFELIDLSPLMFEGKASINANDLSSKTLEKIISVKDRDLIIYYLEWNEVCELAIKHYRAVVSEIIQRKDFSRWNVLANLKEYTETEKYKFALTLAKDTYDYLLIEDAFNKKIIDPSNALRRLIVNE